MAYMISVNSILDFAYGESPKNFTTGEIKFTTDALTFYVTAAPTRPQPTHENKRGEWRPFKQARDFVQQLHLPNSSAWREYAKTNERPKDIPSNPQTSYSRHWVSWYDWLGKTAQHFNNVPTLSANGFVRPSVSLPPRVEFTSVLEPTADYLRHLQIELRKIIDPHIYPSSDPTNASAELITVSVQKSISTTKGTLKDLLCLTLFQDLQKLFVTRCVTCGHPFAFPSSSKGFCSGKCYHQAYNREKRTRS